MRSFGCFWYVRLRSNLDAGKYGYLLVATHGIFDSFGFGLLSFVVVSLIGYALIAVRLKYRRKIVRDFVLSTVGPKVIYDPET